MASALNSSEQTIARAGRRLVWGRALRLAGWGVLGLSILAAILVVVVHAMGQTIVGVWYAWAAGGVVGVSLLLGLAVAWLGRAKTEQVAVLVDERLGLKDTLGTSLYAQTLDEGPVSQRVREDAQGVAQQVAGKPLREAFLVRPTQVWGWGLGGDGVCGGVVVGSFEIG